jgi:uncharacterized OB-fold protein
MQNKVHMTILCCKACGTFFIPPKYLCTKCGHEILGKYQTSGYGKIYTFTTIHVAPPSFKNQTPYDLAVVELDEQIKVTVRIIRDDESPLKIAEPVHFLKKDEVGYWFKA